MKYLLINDHGQRLTHQKFWSGLAQGWLWTKKEMEDIIDMSFSWTFKPTHYQAAHLENGKVVTEGPPIEILMRCAGGMKPETE